MGQRRHEGKCCICGSIGWLSFEHVPPESAFNDQRVLYADITKVIELNLGPDDLGKARERYSQKGAGRHSLCERCNTTTGSWYAAHYVNFVRRAHSLVTTSNGQLKLVYPYSIAPLPVLKQIAAMFFSACGPEFGEQQSDLARFVLDKHSREWPRHVRVYGYLMHPSKSKVMRQSGISGLINLSGGTRVLSEIAFPPLGYILQIDGQPLLSNFQEMHSFAQYNFADRRILYLRFPVLPVVSWLPGDFRSIEEINFQALEHD